MNYKNEAKEAIKRIDRIIQQWEESWLDSREAIEVLIPDLKTIIYYFERIQDEVDEGCYKKRGIIIDKEKAHNNQAEKEAEKEGEK